MRIDDHLRAYSWNEVHAVEVEASAEAVMAAVRAVTAGEIRLLRLLLGLRALPTRLLRRPAADRDEARPVLDGMRRAGFVTLGEDPGREIVDQRRGASAG